MEMHRERELRLCDVRSTKGGGDGLQGGTGRSLRSCELNDSCLIAVLCDCAFGKGLNWVKIETRKAIRALRFISSQQSGIAGAVSKAHCACICTATRCTAKEMQCGASKQQDPSHHRRSHSVASDSQCRKHTPLQ